MKEFLNTNKYSATTFDALKMSKVLDVRRIRKGHPTYVNRMPFLCLMNCGVVNQKFNRVNRFLKLSYVTFIRKHRGTFMINLLFRSTKIPNIVFTYWMAELPPSEFVVFFCILWNSYSMRSKNVSISLKEMESSIGISKTTISSALKKLLDRGLLSKGHRMLDNGKFAPNQYRINEIVFNRKKPKDQKFNIGHSLLKEQIR